MLVVLLIRGVTLPGAAQGIQFYLYPNLTRLWDPQVRHADGAVPVLSWASLLLDNPRHPRWRGGVSTHLPLLGSQLPGNPGALRPSWCFVVFLGGCKCVLTAFPLGSPLPLPPIPSGCLLSFRAASLSPDPPLAPLSCPLPTRPAPDHGSQRLPGPAGWWCRVSCVLSRGPRPFPPGPPFRVHPPGGGVSADRGCGRQGLY